MNEKYTKEKIDNLKHRYRAYSDKKEVILDLMLELNVSHRQARRLNSIHKIWAGYKDQPGEISVVSDNPKSLEDVIKTLNIDLQKWSVKGFRTEGPKANGQFSYSVNFEAKPIDREELLKNFIEQAKQHAPKKFTIEKKNKKAKGLYVLNMQDSHFGKLAWNPETLWGDYDLKLAKEAYLNSFFDLMSKVPQEGIDKILLIIGSDMIHADSPENKTTGDTPQSCDSRWAKMYNECCNVMTEVIEVLASKYEVEGMVIAGNHAAVSEYALGSYLKAWFRNHKNVKIDNEPSFRKYFSYGNTLFMFTHGNKGLKDLPLVMFREKRDVVSKHKYFEIITGDKHTDRLDEIKGVKIRTAPSISGTDAWHSENKFVGNVRTAQGLYYDKENGIEAVYYSKPIE
jgi:hypothetical protein